MSVNRDSKTKLAADVGRRGLETSSITTTSELASAGESRKNTVLTSGITITATSTLFLLTYTGSGKLIIADNAVFLFNQVGTASGVPGEIIITAGGIGAGTFTDVSLQNDFYNWDVGKNPAVNFTAVQGVSGDTLTAPTQQINFLFSSAQTGAAQLKPFVMESNAVYGLGVQLPAGITSAEVQIAASVYEEIDL